MSRTMTVKDVARFFGVHEKTVYNWMRKDPNFPKGFKKFGVRRFLSSDIENYWNDNPYSPPDGYYDLGADGEKIYVPREEYENER
ncbi:MAG: helix-turn-helix domain-containing protein [Deltaproteobacteria bacterium]|nr:helix-turn-helix domain-containing protein [Deltaproteobacteria bacterium]MBW2307051.1 helix-turn-helix domain-containing protein [Deltaproteobacteria bacterium]